MLTCPHSPVECSACRIARRKAERIADAGPVDMAAQIAATRAAVAARETERKNVVALQRARQLYSQAMEWPSCGERWPMDSSEKRADALLRSHKEILP